MTAFARYDSRELRATHYNGVWFVVRRDLYPHTTYDTSAHGSIQVTRQGEAIWVGARQGNTPDGGFTFRRYERADTDLS